MEFVYEKLEVWKKAVDFGVKVSAMVADKSNDRKLTSVLQAIDNSVVNVSTAIARGKGYAAKHDFTQHLYLSRGSMYETMTLLEILKRKRVISDDQYAEYESMGQKVTAMLNGLIISIYRPKIEDDEKGRRSDSWKSRKGER